MSSPAGLHVEMAQWIANVQEVEAAEDLEEQDAVLQTIKSWHHSSIKWKLITLDNLFGGTRHKPVRSLQKDGNMGEFQWNPLHSWTRLK